MAFQLSPGVNVTEVDLTTIVPSVATTDGAIAGVFRWGPVNEATLITNETNLANRFGKPTNLNAETWFNAASFLTYSNRLYVSRAANTTGTSPILTSAVVEVANATVLVTSTTGVTVGMSVLTSSNSEVEDAIAPGATVSEIANSTAFILSSNSFAVQALTGGTIQLLSNTAFNAIANGGSVASLAGQVVRNEDHFLSKTVGDFDSDVYFVAKYPGDIGNSLRISVCANPQGYTSTLNFGNSQNYVANASTTKTSNIGFVVNQNSATLTVRIDSSDYASSNTEANSTIWGLYNLLRVNDNLQVGNATIGNQYLKITSLGDPVVTGNTTNAVASFTLSFEDRFGLSSNITYTSNSPTSNTLARFWEFFGVVDAAPGKSDYVINFGNNSINSDEMHVVIVDDGGKITGVPGSILETFKAVSRATDAKTIDGGANYYKDIINDVSAYVYAINDLSGAISNTAINLSDSTLGNIFYNFKCGKDGADESNIPVSVLAPAYDVFASADAIDISLLLTGKSNGFQLANYLIDNIAEARKDCVVFISPEKSDVVNNNGNEANDIVAFRNNLRSTSYAVLDSGYKYMYDRYNDIYRYVPLNGDIAGTCARTDNVSDPWFSPAGFNRGQIRNLIRLAYNPKKEDRDTLYKAGINPVVSFTGQGTVLYGDKTLLSKPSAFDRINVRRLFIVLEKAIARASQSTLFEFNDEFTRAQFRNLINPFLRDIKSGRGITDFLVVCDDSNNTSEVIDRNEFVGDIYIKPARAINFIQLNFVAVRSGVSFSEVVGQF